MRRAVQLLFILPIIFIYINLDAKTLGHDGKRSGNTLAHQNELDHLIDRSEPVVIEEEELEVVTIKDDNNLTGQFSKKLMLVNHLAAQKSEDEIVVYAGAANNIITVNSACGGKYEILSDGVVVKRGRLEQGMTMISSRELNKGEYLLSVKASDLNEKKVRLVK